MAASPGRPAPAVACALFNFMNRLVEGLGIELQEAYVPMAAERLSKKGYTELLRMLGDGKS